MLFEQLQTEDKCWSDCVAHNSMELQKQHWAHFIFHLIYVQDVLLIFKDTDNRASAQPSASFGSHNTHLPLVHVNVL